jgi:hypothetical protein
MALFEITRSRFVWDKHKGTSEINESPSLERSDNQPLTKMQLYNGTEERITWRRVGWANVDLANATS